MANLTKEYLSIENSLVVNGLEGMLNRAKQTVSCDISQLPISTNVLQKSEHRIVISDNCIEDIALIKSTIDQQKTTGSKHELAFAFLGHKENGVMHIDKIVYYPEDYMNGNQQEADFKKLSKDYYKHCKEVEEPAVILGHTHPTQADDKIGNSHSMHDLYQLKEIERIGREYNPKATVGGMVLNGAGDFNTIFYDRETDKFSRASEIGFESTPLPSFSDGRYLEPTPQVQRITAEELRPYEQNSHYGEKYKPEKTKAMFAKDIAKVGKNKKLLNEISERYR